MLVQSALLSVCLLGTVFVSAFDSTEIRLLEWPRGAKTFTKRSDNDILDLGALGPLARFRKSENFGRMVRNQDMLKDPLIRFGKRSSAPRRLAARSYRLQVSDPWQ